jgi:hypothetical protein
MSFSSGRRSWLERQQVDEMLAQRLNESKRKMSILILSNQPVKKKTKKFLSYKSLM